MLTLSLLSLLAAPAAAADHELSFELGTLAAKDPAYGTFSDRQTQLSVGARAGYALLPRLELTAGFRRRTLAMGHQFNSASIGGADVPGGSEGYVAQLATNTWTVGAKADVDVMHYLHPYVGAQGVLLQGAARVDDDRDADDNQNQLLERALAPGFAVVGGVDLYLGLPEWPASPALFLEMGYSRVARMELGDLGDVQFKGFTLRSGVGVRF